MSNIYYVAAELDGHFRAYRDPYNYVRMYRTDDGFGYNIPFRMSISYVKPFYTHVIGDDPLRALLAGNIYNIPDDVRERSAELVYNEYGCFLVANGMIIGKLEYGKYASYAELLDNIAPEVDSPHAIASTKEISMLSGGVELRSEYLAVQLHAPRSRSQVQVVRTADSFNGYKLIDAIEAVEACCNELTEEPEHNLRLGVRQRYAYIENWCNGRRDVKLYLFIPPAQHVSDVTKQYDISPSVAKYVHDHADIGVVLGLAYGERIAFLKQLATYIKRYGTCSDLVLIKAADGLYRKYAVTVAVTDV